MKLRMNLLDNALSFLNTSLYFIGQTDEYSHNECFADEETSTQYKMAIINIVQAIELIFKECLRKVHTVLIYEDIDKATSTKAKTVSISLALDRLIDICNIKISENDILLIKDAIKTRNEIMHYEFETSSEEAKVKYGRIYTFIKKFYKEQFSEDISSKILNKYISIEKNIMYFAENLVPFRGTEVNKAELEEIKNDIRENSIKTHYCIDGQLYERIRFGNETTSFFCAYDKFCGDCISIIGEFHMSGCDMEECPKCHGQAISCSCDYGDDNDIK
jgi:hypothetical protein